MASAAAATSAAADTPKLGAEDMANDGVVAPLKLSISNHSISTCGSENEGTPRDDESGSTSAGEQPSPVGTLSVGEERLGEDEYEEHLMFEDEEEEESESEQGSWKRSESRTSPQQGSTSAQGPSSRSSWRVVWCHERCHKQEEETLRNSIADAVSDCGGAFTCYKKAKTFETWAARAPRPNYLLLTDGREVKPCVQALMGMATNRPKMIVVLSEKAKHATRVSQWARDLPSQGFNIQVRIIRSIEEFASVLAGSLPVLSKPAFQFSPGMGRPMNFHGAKGQHPLSMRHATSPMAMNASACMPLATFPTGGAAVYMPFDLRALPMLPGAAASVASVSPTPTAASAAASDFGTMLTGTSPTALQQRSAMALADATRQYSTSWAPASPVVSSPGAVQEPGTPFSSAWGAQPAGISCESSFLMEKSSEGVAPPVLQVLAPAFPSLTDATTLERILAMSAPEMYEE